jgi:hypothetical protein
MNHIKLSETRKIILNGYEFDLTRISIDGVEIDRYELGNTICDVPLSKACETEYYQEQVSRHRAYHALFIQNTGKLRCNSKKLIGPYALKIFERNMRNMLKNDDFEFLEHSKYVSVMFDGGMENVAKKRLRDLLHRSQYTMDYNFIIGKTRVAININDKVYLVGISKTDTPYIVYLKVKATIWIVLHNESFNEITSYFID